MSPVAAPVLTGVRLKTKDGDWLVHPDLRDIMVKDAQEKGTNLTDLAVRILSAKYGVRYIENTRRSRPSRDSDEQMNFRLPPALKQKIGKANFPIGVVAAIRRDLCQHYGLPLPAAADAG